MNVSPPRCAIDIGISTTDAVAGWRPEDSVTLPTGDPVGTARDALSDLVEGGAPTEPPLVAVTGAYSSRIEDRLGGFEVLHVNEIDAIGIGGVRLAERSEALVVSLGTGIAFVSVRGSEVTHVVPGTGVGGGTLRGLSRLLLGGDDLEAVAALAASGDRSRFDLTIQDVFGGPLGGLPESATASNFGRQTDGRDRGDIAAALANLVAEVSLTVTLLALRASGQTSAVLTGKLLLFPPIRDRLESAKEMTGNLLTIPPRAEIATALGALWAPDRERNAGE